MNDGTYYGDNFSSRESGYKCHEREPDKKLQLIKMVRGEDKKDILLVSWQSHPKLASTASTMNGKLTRPLLSADYVGYMRDYVGMKADCEVAFFLGAAGNLNPLSDIAEDYLADNARLVMKEWAANNNFKETVAFGKPLGIMSPYHAESILNRFNDPNPTKELEINAVSFGDVGFATVPYEMFCQNGLAVKEGSPFETTFMISCCNGVNGYMAADAAFEYNSYEANNRIFIRGTAEAVQDKLIAMLQSLQ